MAQLALVANSATSWHQLFWSQFWPPVGANCFGHKFGHQVAPLALDPNLATPSGGAALPGIDYLTGTIEFNSMSWYLHQPESHQLNFNKVCRSWTDIRTHRPKPRFTWVRQKSNIEKKCHQSASIRILMISWEWMILVFDVC